MNNSKIPSIGKKRGDEDRKRRETTKQVSV